MRTILHVDLNNFFASVECMYDPSLRGLPVAVCGDIELRHGIVLAKNYEAKAAGVRTGYTIADAKRACPGLVCVLPHMDRYMRFSAMAKGIYSDYTYRVESFGIDECWLDLGVTDKGVSTADEIRRRIRRELGVTASAGVSYNKIFAKMGSDYKKPDATTEITEDNFKDLLWRLPVSDMMFIGRATENKLRLYGIETIEDFRSFAAPELLEVVVHSVKGIGDAGTHYLFMLAGDENRCKPDVHIHQCIKDACGEDISNDDCQTLFRETVKILKKDHPTLTMAKLDGIIWNKYRA